MKRLERDTHQRHALVLLMIVYGAASLAHFVHNALYVQQYPNLPEWITPWVVYASWCGIAAVGVLGYWLLRRGLRVIGLLVTAVYALFGFSGLDHYTRAPFAAHSIAMNATIILEAVAAFALMIALAYCARFIRVKGIQVS